MRAFLFVILSALAVRQDAADDQYQYVVGLFEKGLHDRVVKEAESFLADHPRHAKADLARYRLAAALFELKRESDALPHLRQLAERRGFEFESEVLFRLGQCELSADHYDAAASAFDRVIALGKAYLVEPSTWMCGEAHFRAQDYAGAQKLYAKSLALAPHGTYAADAACGLAWCEFRSGRKEQALDKIEAALDLVGDGERQSEMAFLAGECLLDLQRAEAALQAYGAVKRGPFADAALRGAAFARSATGDHPGAARDFRAVIERFPKSRFAPECALHAGIESLAAGDAKAALTVLSSPAVSDDGEVSYWRARAQSESGDPRAAIETVDRALAREKKGELAERLGVLRGDLLAANGDPKAALTAYERSGSDYALQRAAVLCLNEGRTADALRMAKKLLSDFPKSEHAAAARTVLGEALFAEKDYRAAEAAFRAVAEAESDGPRALAARSRIAWCRYLAGRPAEAAPMFGEIARMATDEKAAGEACFMEGRSREAAGDIPAALTAFRDMLARHGTHERSGDAMLRLARLDPSDDSTQRLEKLASARPKLDPIAAEACHEIAERLSSAGKFAAARQRYAEVSQRDPKSPLCASATYGSAWCLYNEGSYPEAAAALESLRASDSVDDVLRSAAAELSVWTECKLGRPAQIAAAFDAFAHMSTDEARCVRAARTAIAALKKAGDAARARALVDSIAKRTRAKELTAGIAVESAYLYLDAGKIDAAEQDLERARRASPDDATVGEAAFFVGEARFDKGDTEKASALYAAAVQNKSNPVRDRALYKQGFAFLRAQAYDAAERAFRTLVEEHPKSELLHESLFLLGEAQYRRGDFQAAVASLTRVLSEAPRHAVRPKALFRLGLALGRLERWKESADALSTLARETPDFENAAEAELARGRALAATRDPRGARAAFDRVIALDRGGLSGQAHLELGRLHQTGGNLDQALSEFLKVAVLYADPEAVGEALLCAGGVLESQGDVERARSQYRELVEKHADTRFAAEARTRLRAIGSK